MGMDFVALLRYHRTPEVVRRIAALESQTAPLSAEVAALWAEQQFAPLPWTHSCWIAHDNGQQLKRPSGPSLQVALRTVDGFFLTFGQGACCVYHLLRWRFFLTDPRWQAAMLEVCYSLGERFEATEGAIMSDFHPAYRAFFSGKRYHACFHDLPPEEEAVESISALYQAVPPDTWTSHGYWPFRPAPITEEGES